MSGTYVETPAGTLYAVPSGDQNYYPGIVIGLKKDGAEAEFVLVEVDKETGNLALHVWNFDESVWDADPVYEQGATPEEITKMLKGEVE